MPASALKSDLGTGLNQTETNNMNNNRNYNSSYDIEARKKGPFSIFVLSYELPPPPTDFKHPHDKHRFAMEQHKERKSIAREWHKNHTRRRSVPANVLV